MSETPRTDEFICKLMDRWPDTKDVDLDEVRRELLHHAHILERDLAEAVKWRGVMTEIADKAQERGANMAATADALQAALSAAEQRAEAMGVRNKELLEALILLEAEMVASGNAQSRDFNWLPAITKARAAIASGAGDQK